MEIKRNLRRVLADYHTASLHSPALFIGLCDLLECVCHAGKDCDLLAYAPEYKGYECTDRALWRVLGNNVREVALDDSVLPGMWDEGGAMQSVVEAVNVLEGHLDGS